VRVEGYDPQEIAAVLDASYGIQVRAGLHCAPLVHRAIGSFSGGGTVRFSFNPSNTLDEIDAAAAAMVEIATATGARIAEPAR
jgi:selenocysteine lyase/cysteine desulfurase